jgi:hypothetical protein
VDQVTGAGMFPDPPEPPHLVQTAAQSPWGGSSYAYRGARVEYAPGGYVCGLFMPEHPLHGRNFRVVGTVTTLVDLWLEEGRLPDYIRAVPKVRR